MAIKKINLLLTRPDDSDLMVSVTLNSEDIRRIQTILTFLKDLHLQSAMDSSTIPFDIISVPAKHPKGTNGPELHQAIHPDNESADSDDLSQIRTLGVRIFADGDIVFVAYHNYTGDEYESETFDTLPLSNMV